MTIMIIDDPLDDSPTTEEQKKKMLAWFDEVFGDRYQSSTSMIIVYPSIRCRGPESPPKKDDT